MKLSVFLLVGSMSLAQAADSYAQKATVSIEMRNQTVKEVLDEIEEQSDFSFFFNIKHVDLDRKVSVVANKSDIFKVLDNIFAGTNVHYSVVDRKIILSTEKQGMAVSQQQKGKKITGVIKDQNGEPVIGANVVVKGTTNGTITDIDGKFNLEVPENAVLSITYIGYNPMEIKTGKDSVLDIVMKEDTQALDEVVVVAYGTQKKVNLTAAVETVDRKVLSNRPVRTTSEMLEGVVPNLNISTTSGAPDASSSLNIRGFTGMTVNDKKELVTESGSPLVLVDGVEQSMDFVNPNDIESISVLKDAAASAIYGSRAPYGVILITTKSGEKGKKTAIQYSGTYQMSQPSMLPKSASSVDFANIHNRSFRNTLQEGPYAESVIQKMQDYIDGKLDTYNEIQPNGWWGEHFAAFANTDYYDYAFRDVSHSTTHDVNVSGGTAKSSYYAGLGYNYKQGLYNSDIDKYKRYSAILKVETDIADWLSFNMNTRYVRQETVRPAYRNADSSSGSDSNFMNALAYYPNIPIKNPDGSWHRLSAMPALTGEQGRMDKTIDDFWLSGGLKLTPIKDLTIKSNFSWNMQSALDDRSNLVVYVDEPNGDRPMSARSSTIDKLWKKSFRSNYFTMDLTADYHKSFGKHDLGVLVGLQSEYKQNHNMIGSVSGLYTQDIPSFNLSWGDNMVLTDEKNHWSTMGAFFRLTYNYDSRYLLDVNGRYDAASKYPSDTRWAFFPSVSAGWNIAREAFWPIEEISTLKITGSFGKLGDQAGSNYLYIPTMSTGTSGMVINGVKPKYISMPGIVAENITWAKPQTVGIGAEVAALSNRLRGEYYWYQRTVYDQLGPASTLPEVLGVTPPQTNNAVSETRGWEMSLSWRDQACTLAGSPLNYNVRFILSDYVGYVVRYPDNVTGIRTSWTPGQVFGELYGYRSAGIATNKDALTNHVLPGTGWYYTGDLLFQDLNGDGIINKGTGETWYSMGDLERLGYTYPRMKYAINLGLDWKNFSFSMFLDGVGKEVRYINNFNVFGATGDHSSRRMFQQHVDLGYWSEHSKDAFFPRSYINSKNFSNANDQYLINLAHLRIKNINFGYTVPSHLVSKLKLNNLSFNLSIENLGFIYNKSWLDLDPQMIRQNGNGYPIQRTYSIGVRLGI